MRKNLEKVFASASIVVAVVLIMILLVTAFGGISADEFQSKLVQGLLITLSVLYILLAVTTLVMMFIASDVVKEIVLRSEQGGSVRASIGVVRKTVKNTCADVDGIKCQKVALVNDEYGVRLKLSVKVVDRDVLEAETYVRTLLEDVFKNSLGFKFHTIEIKVVSLQSKYQPDKAAIKEQVEEKLENMKTQEASVIPSATAAEEAAAEAKEADPEVASETSANEQTEAAAETEVAEKTVAEEAAENESEVEEPKESPESEADGKPEEIEE